MSEPMPPARPDPAMPPATPSPAYSTAVTPGGQPPYNLLAILAFVFVWITVIVGIILGHIALSQIKRTGERGHGLALAAVIIGWVALGLGIVITAIVFISLGFFAVSNNNTNNM
jgi:hypothetical protein